MKLAEWLLNLIYPPKCVFCAKLLQKDETDICASCRKELPKVNNTLRRGAHYETCHAAYFYESHVAQSILRFKFAGRSHYADAYGRELAMLILRERIDFDVLSWVPISDKRAKKRGYRQSKLMAQAIAKELGIKAEQTLKKIKDNPAQSSLKNPKDRKGNVADVYRAVSPEKFDQQRVLLVDDVVTSGATLSECARILKKAGAKSVVCITLAATRN